MVDFRTQGFIFWTSAILLTLSIPVSIWYAFYVDNYLKGMMIVVYVSAALMVLFVPPWPWLNMYQPKWQPDSMYKEPVEAPPARPGKPKHD